jgi:hypothetical protein
MADPDVSGVGSEGGMEGEDAGLLVLPFLLVVLGDDLEQRERDGCLEAGDIRRLVLGMREGLEAGLALPAAAPAGARERRRVEEEGREVEVRPVVTDRVH